MKNKLNRPLPPPLPTTAEEMLERKAKIAEQQRLHKALRAAAEVNSKNADLNLRGKQP